MTHIVSIVTPPPYDKITFECSNRAFYDIACQIYDIACNIEDQDMYEYTDYFTEKRDYEGDLELIIFRYDNEDELNVKIAEALRAVYGFASKGERDVHFSIF